MCVCLCVCACAQCTGQCSTGAPPSTTHKDVVIGCRCGGLVYNTAKCLGRGLLSRSVIKGRAM